MSRPEQISTLENLIDDNHSHLVTLGVGHAALEVVRRTTMEQPWGLHTKLTGAGGGGCAVTIIPDGNYYSELGSSHYLSTNLISTDFAEASLQTLKTALADAGFVTYETTVGGSGFGILLSGGDPSAEDVSNSSLQKAEERFSSAPAHELAEWAQKAGSWAFV